MQLLFALLGNTTSETAPEREQPFSNGNTTPIKHIFTYDLRSPRLPAFQSHVSLLASLCGVERTKELGKAGMTYMVYHVMGRVA